jgi:hypothetical protein
VLPRIFWTCNFYVLLCVFDGRYYGVFHSGNSFEEWGRAVGGGTAANVTELVAATQSSGKKRASEAAELRSIALCVQGSPSEKHRSCDHRKAHTNTYRLHVHNLFKIHVNMHMYVHICENTNTSNITPGSD